jgi:phosphoribosylformimino-5-aminoimidazole carboxamide ribotide isomerase
MNKRDATPRLIPVIDVRGGIVVRAVAGQRDRYRPLVSRLINSIDPFAVAATLCRNTQTNEIYVADLDAIVDGAPSFDIYTKLNAEGFSCWLDAGIRTNLEALSVAKFGVNVIVVGLETIRSVEELRAAVGLLGPSRLAFSLDLRDGRPICDPTVWDPDPEIIANMAVGAGVQKMIVLDLSRVGVGSGTGTERLCSTLKSRFPNLELVAGGGIRTIKDIRSLGEAGVSAVLVASALHDGLINPENWQA